MPGQDFSYDKDNLVYSLNKVLTQIIVKIFRENLIDKKTVRIMTYFQLSRK